MPKLTNRASKIIRNRKGESIIESVISLLILTTLIATIAMITRTALRISEKYTTDATTMQQTHINTMIQENYTTTPQAELELNGYGIHVNIPIELYKIDNITAFYPKRVTTQK